LNNARDVPGSRNLICGGFAPSDFVKSLAEKPGLVPVSSVPGSLYGTLKAWYLEEVKLNRLSLP
jgi:hypothetical protein